MSRTGPPSASLLVRILKSYGDDWRKWLNGIGARYATGIGLVAAGALLLMVAAGIGTAAAFHYLEMGYGAYIAYAIVGGAYGALGIAGLFGGRWLLGRAITPVPTPRRQAQMLKRATSIPAATLFLASNRRGASGPDLLTQVLAAGAAATLLGWVAVTYLQRRQVQRRQGADRT